MKIILIIFISLALTYSCNNKVDQNTEAINIKKSQLKNPLVGLWQMCKSTENGRETLYNVCPTIIFFDNGTGKIKSLEETVCDFQFISKNDIIVFSFKSLDEKETFFATGTDFNVKLHIQDNIETLELSQLKTNYKFILSRVLQK